MYYNFECHVVPSDASWLSTEEFPIHRGLSVLNGGIAMQDCLLLMRNNVKYLSTKLLLFSDTFSLTFTNRYRNAVRWDTIAHFYSESEKFRDCVTKRSVILTDKQDPSLVTELCYTYQMFYDHKCDATGLWLELIYMTLSAFYGKSLSPEERMVNVSIVRAILITSRVS
jgi:hypothetical protein